MGVPLLMATVYSESRSLDKTSIEAIYHFALCQPMMAGVSFVGPCSTLGVV